MSKCAFDRFPLRRVVLERPNRPCAGFWENVKKGCYAIEKRDVGGSLINVKTAIALDGRLIFAMF